MVRCAEMAEREPSSPSPAPPQIEPQSPADRTLLGVAPPRIESTPDSALRSPVFVRSGTSVAEVDPPPLPRMALPSRPAPPMPSEPPAALSASSASIDDGSSVSGRQGYARFARLHPALWMVAAPVALASIVIGATVALTPARSPQPALKEPIKAATVPAPKAAEPEVVTQRSATLAELEARPPESLSARELIRVADGRAERRVAEARALGQKLEQSPALASEKATQAELLRLARDNETAREALAALARLTTPLGADLLYEVWAGTPERSEATELARALVYSADVRPHASAALSVALDLRAAQSCEAVKVVLPRALKDGDRRALSQLTKLSVKRGCGARKSEDCYPCLRAEPDELKATLNAAKSRRPPL